MKILIATKALPGTWPTAVNIGSQTVSVTRVTSGDVAVDVMMFDVVAAFEVEVAQ